MTDQSNAVKAGTRLRAEDRCTGIYGDVHYIYIYIRSFRLGMRALGLQQCCNVAYECGVRLRHHPKPYTLQEEAWGGVGGVVVYSPVKARVVQPQE